MGSEQHGPWTWLATTKRLHTSWFTVYEDEVSTPAGRPGIYPWLDAVDAVRVAAMTAAGEVYVVEQYLYLPRRRMWQLPGGSIDGAETPGVAAARELSEEVGMHADRWTSLGSVWPIPSLSPARVHLWLAEGLTPHAAHPEEGEEVDLVARAVPLAEAVDAALTGRIGCAASAKLVLAVARQCG